MAARSKTPQRLEDADAEFLLAMHTEGGTRLQSSAFISLLPKPWSERLVEAIRHLCRMRDRGLITNEQTEKSGPPLWTITDAAMALKAQWLPAIQPPTSPQPESVPTPAEAPVPEQLPPPEAKPEPPVPALSTRQKKALRKRERLKETINQVFGQLTPAKNPSIPDDARFVYREIISGLPESLRKTLNPITVWVGEPKQ